jgi:hypothetical protein
MSSPQRVAVVTVQLAPLGVTTQHAPVSWGGGQALSPQVVPGPRHTPLSAVQAASVRTEQVTAPEAVAMQHAPVGAGQVSGPQIVPAPRHVPLAAVHWACVVTTQFVTVPAIGPQQAPVAGAQLVVEQTVLSPR